MAAARKNPCLQASFPTIAAEANTLNASPDAIVAVVFADAGTDPVAASPIQQPNVGAAQAPRRGWTPEEDTKLTYAVKTTGKKKYGEEYRTDWGAVAAMVPGRTKKLCKGGWHNELDSKSDETTAGAGEKWTRDEDSTLTDAVKKHNGEGWAAIATLVSGQTKTQCTSRWHNTLHSKNIETTARKGKWAADEDSTLTDAVKKHNGNDWSAISKLVPGRTKKTV
jgi:hypothetical protein